MVNNVFFILLIVLLGCQNQHHNQQKFTTLPILKTDLNRYAKKYDVIVEKSIIEWKGTKLMGTGSHTGTVNFKEGYLLISSNDLIGGEFTIDMRSIYITDIPLSDPIPRKNITTHLNSDFDTDKYPLAHFKITSIKKDADVYNLVGSLTIRDKTNQISIKAFKQAQQKFISEFTINRFDWGIGENGTWLEKKLVDADIELKIRIEVQRK